MLAVQPNQKITPCVFRASDTGVRVSGSPLGSLEPITKITPCVSRAPRARVSCCPSGAGILCPRHSGAGCQWGSVMTGSPDGNCRSGMSFQLMDPDAKLPMFTTRVAAAVSPS